MSNKTELDTLYDQLKQIENYYGNQLKPFDEAITYSYLMIKKRINILESIKFLSISSPRTLDPYKIKKHLKLVIGYLKSINTINSNALNEKITFIEKQFTVVYPYQKIPNKKPDNNVDFYYYEITKLMVEFFKLWKIEFGIIN